MVQKVLVYVTENKVRVTSFMIFHTTLVVKHTLSASSLERLIDIRILNNMPVLLKVLKAYSRLTNQTLFYLSEYKLLILSDNGRRLKIVLYSVGLDDKIYLS